MNVGTVDRIALVLVIIGAINWLLIGLARFNLVGAIFGGDLSVFSRFIYVLVGLSGLWLIKLFMTPRETVNNKS